MTHKRLLQLSLMISALLLQGCGFQLRGAATLPAGVAHVRVVAPTALYEILRFNLETAGAQVSAKAPASDATLSVLQEHFQRRVLSVDPDSGKAREYELGYTLVFRMQDANGADLLPRQQLRLVRDYVFDDDAVIGKSREEGVLKREMREDAAQQMMRRINRIGS